MRTVRIAASLLAADLGKLEQEVDSKDTSSAESVPVIRGS